MNLIETERVIARLRVAGMALDQYKRKCYRLRRLCAGDMDALDEGFPGTNIDAFSRLARPSRTMFEDILVGKFEEGRSNDLLKSIRTLTLQTAYFFPELEFRGTDPKVAALNSAYVKDRNREAPFGCSGVHHQRLALIEYMMGGMGFTYYGTRKGRPIMQYSDSLDMKWDQGARIPQDITWASTVITESLDYWIQMFGSAAFEGLVAFTGRKEPSMDQPLELEFYYDLDGDQGNFKVLACQGNGSYLDKPIFESPNPCYFDVGGERMPFLPFESMFFMALPSVRWPIGLAEGMLPAQVAVWRVDKTIGEIIDRGAGFYEMKDGDVDTKERQKFEDGEVGAFIQTKTGNSITQKPPMDLPGFMINFRNYHAQDIIEQGGASPFATGDKVEGVNFAAQVNAIRAEAGLTAGTIAKDNSEAWERGFRKFLALGKAYDVRPFVCYIDGAEMVFDQSDPVAQYLRPDAEFIIREDSMRFRSREEKIAEASNTLAVSLQVATIFPNAPAKAFVRYLEAIGEHNVEQWTGQPGGGAMGPQMPVAGQGGAPAGPVQPMQAAG